MQTCLAATQHRGMDGAKQGGFRFSRMDNNE
jgi:hypothetical protein